VVRSDKEAKERDHHGRESDSGVTKHPLAAKGRDHFRDNAHAGKDRDVHGWMGIEPKEMSKEEWISTLRGVKKTEPKGSSAMARTGVTSTIRRDAA